MLYIEYVCYMLNTAKFENETKVVFFSLYFLLLAILNVFNKKQ